MLLTLIATYDNSRHLVNSMGEKILTVPKFEVEMRNITLGCTVIMGRETFEKQSSLLNHRNYIVLSTNKDYKVSDPKVKVMYSPEEIIQYLEDTDVKQAYVVGGAKTFSSFTKYATRFIICHLHTNNLQGREKFPLLRKKDFHIEASASKQYYDTNEKKSYTWHKETFFRRDESKRIDMRRSKVPLVLSLHNQSK